MTLLICRTCPRYDSRSTGEFGRELAAAIAEHPAGAAVTVRKVQCLGGCPDDGVAAVDGPGKARVRFSGLHAGHAAAVIAAAAAHDSCASGAPGDWQVPVELADRISSVTPKRRPAGA
jgi:predicted metal-binding protein